jgi:hypothetical protein
MKFLTSFFYITDSGSFFIGWDNKGKKPYWIPKEIIYEKRQHGNLSKFEKQYDRALINQDNIRDKLHEIDWPTELIEKWMKGFKTNQA